MKKLMVLAIAAVSVMSLHAQQFSDFFSTEKSSDKIVYGVRFGLNVMGMRNNVTNDVVVSAFGNLPYKLDIHRRSGITLGANVDIPILKNLWINTGLYYVATSPSPTTVSCPNTVLTSPCTTFASQCRHPGVTTSTATIRCKSTLVLISPMALAAR